MPYEPTDELFLWFLKDPQLPVLIGSLRLVNSGRGVSLTYAESWLRDGFALSEDLPLVDVEHFPRERDAAAGAVNDARPDRWGERVIRIFDKPPRLSVLDFLYFAGDDRFGALGVSTSENEYQPRTFGPLPRIADVDQIHQLVLKVKANEPIEEPLRRLLAPGVTMGGMRPKGLVEVEGEQWMVKFRDEDIVDAPLVEHACMRLADAAGITVAHTKAIKLQSGHAVAVKRFDRENGKRIHALSAKVCLSAEGSEMGYPELAQLLRRRARTDNNEFKSQMRELFRRMVFNILMDNTDDHERNHVLLSDDQGYLSLSPAFDVLPTCQSLGYQQMRVGTRQNDSTLENALSETAQFGLTYAAAEQEAKAVAAVCSEWKDAFARCEISLQEIEAVAAHVDRPYLADQRKALLN